MGSKSIEISGLDRFRLPGVHCITEVVPDDNVSKDQDVFIRWLQLTFECGLSIKVPVQLDTSELKTTDVQDGYLVECDWESPFYVGQMVSIRPRENGNLAVRPVNGWSNRLE